MKKYMNGKLNGKLALATFLGAGLVSPALSLVAHAADTQTTLPQTAATTRSTEDSRDRQSRALWLYGSFGAGYGSVQGNEFGNNPDGTDLMLGGVLAYKIPDFVFDLGAYWQQVSLSGSLPTGQSVDIKTRSGLLEFSPRYRISQVVDVGPVGYLSFGSNTNFSPVDDGTDAAAFAGLKVSYEIPSDVLNMRLTAAVARDVSVSNRDVYLALAGIQIGLPISAGRSYPESAPAPLPVVKQDTIVVTKAAPVKAIAKAELRVSLSPKVVYFNTASARMGANAKRIVREIGAFLAKNDAAWGALEISGHTDSRGSYKYNLNLSDKRSQAVMEDLARGGARPSKIKAEAFAFTRPVATGKDKASLAQNRRVELVFKNVSDPNLIEKEIRKIVEGETNMVKAKKVEKIPS